MCRRPVAETVLALHADTQYYTCRRIPREIGKLIAGNGRVKCHAPGVMGGHMSRGVTGSSARAGVIICSRHVTTWQR